MNRTIAPARTFENCWQFRYVATNHGNLWFCHTRNTFGDSPDTAWVTEARSQDGRQSRKTYRSSEEMRFIWNHMHCVAECEYYGLS